MEITAIALVEDSDSRKLSRRNRGKGKGRQHGSSTKSSKKEKGKGHKNRHHVKLIPTMSPVCFHPSTPYYPHPTFPNCFPAPTPFHQRPMSQYPIIFPPRQPFVFPREQVVFPEQPTSSGAAANCSSSFTFIISFLIMKYLII